MRERRGPVDNVQGCGLDAPDLQKKRAQRFTKEVIILMTLEILKTSLLFPCHEPITIEIASATAGLFCGTICPLMKDKQNL